MRVRLTEIKLRPTGKRVRLDRDLEVESLFIGRGPDNDLALKGLTISLHHATIRMSEGRIYIEAAAGKEINVNGLVTAGERLSLGDRIRIGSWELRVLEPDTSMEMSLEYEEIDRADSERSALDARTRLGIERGVLARRPLAWSGVALIFVLFLMVPLFWKPAQSAWTTGGVSRGHTYIEQECQQCHSGSFHSVRNADCLTCHYDIGRHTASEISVDQLDSAACSDCHLEHRGPEAFLADRGSRFCSDCHVKLSSVVRDTELAAASDFGSHHPAFKLAVVTNPDLAPVRALVTEDLLEDSGLNFNHFMHVGSGITNAEDEEQYMHCGTCHQPDTNGQMMKPVVFEDHCQQCHELDFDSTSPNVHVPHGDAAQIRTFIREFYWTRVLSGEIRDKSAPSEIRNRESGQSLETDESSIARQWVDSKLIDVESGFFGRAGTCKTCHDVESGHSADGGLGVRSVQVQTDWTPGVGFSHDSHTPFTCARCHPKAAVFDADVDLDRPEWSFEDSIPYELIEQRDDTDVSEDASDILIPAIDTCRECHSGMNDSGTGVVPSPCSMCHPFHVRELGTMRSASFNASLSPSLDAPADD